MSPDNTSDGWLRKKWTIIENERYLLKAGSKPFLQEPFNEVITNIMLKYLDLNPHLTYQLHQFNNEILCSCKNFVTQETERVTANQLNKTLKKHKHISSYNHLINCCTSAGIKNAQQHIDNILICDYLIVNEDRHFNNFGFIRNVENLQLTQPAPIFDSGTSLYYNTQDFEITTAQIQSKPFKTDHEKQIKLVKSFEHINLANLKNIDEEFNELLKKSPHISEMRRSLLCKTLQKRIKKLTQHIETSLKPRLAVK